MKLPSRSPLLPPKATAANLFLVGSTVGPVVDSLHNQCLLAYDIAPITLGVSSVSSSPVFCSSWVVPPLLGIAYIVLGFILPRIIELVIRPKSLSIDNQRMHKRDLERRAILAVTSTALIIKLSQFLQTHDVIALGDYTFLLDTKICISIMVAADALQWILLDRTPVALLAATITAYGGPLSELPFVASGFWHYIPESADYLPLSGEIFQQGGIADRVALNILGDNYNTLALSHITGPCYFAVTLDAIALSRYFNQNNTPNT
jgi:hypothetical protein